MAETVKVYEEKTKKGLSIWAWLLPLLLILALIAWFMTRHNDAPATTAAAITDQTKPDSGVGTKSVPATAWTSATIADSIRSKGRVTFNDNDVHFATASAALAGDSQAVLDQTAQALSANADWKMRVVGHTDSTGSSASNDQLAQQRAESVATYLAGKGIAKDRLSTDAKGQNEPVASNNSDAGRADNRRVELIRQ